MDPIKFDVKAFIRQQAEESGMTSDDAVLFANKCYDGMPMAMWQPYGGAESFEEIATKEAADLYQGNVNQLTYQLQSVISNIMQNENLNAGEKSTSISKAAADYETKMAALDISKGPVEQGTKALSGDFLQRFKNLWTGQKKSFSTEQRKKLAASGAAMADGSYPIESAGDVSNAVKDYGRTGAGSSVKAHIIKRARAIGATSSLPDDWIGKGKKEAADELSLGEGFKMFVDTQGDLRWLSFSTNAFEDHSRELFSTKAIEDGVAWHDANPETRGPLRVFHIEGADIGTCDFQAVEGRFLIESGTFNDTVLGQKAVQYFEEHPEEEWQVSVGYYYKENDDVDGVYDWVRWKERSILPVGRADNPYTGFWTSHDKTGEKAMHAAAQATLDKLFGPDITKQVIAKAQEGSKQLEESGIRFKMKDDEFGDITDVEEIKPAEGEKAKAPEPVVMSHEHGTVRHKHRVTPESEHSHTGLEVAYKAAKMDAEDKQDQGADEDEEDAQGNKKSSGTKESQEDSTVKLAGVLGEVLSSLEDLKGVATEVKELKEGVKALQASDEERMSSFMQTRWSFPGGVRPTESTNNLVDGTKEGIKEILADGENQQVNPAQAYVDDLFGRQSIQQG